MAEELPNARIPELPPIAVLPIGGLVALYDPIQGITGSFDLSLLIPASSTDYRWSSTTDYGIGEIVTHNGEIWESIDTPNQGNIPADGSAFWEIRSKSSSGLYAPGIYTDDEVYVYAQLDGYYQWFRLATVTRPFNSVDFMDEYAAGDWELMSERQMLMVEQTAHGLTELEVVTHDGGEWIQWTTGFQKLGIVKNVVDADHLLVALFGVTLKGFSGLTPSAVQYAQADGSISEVLSDDAIAVAISATQVVLLASGGSGASGDFWALTGTSTLLGNVIVDADGNGIYIGESVNGGALAIFGPSSSLIALDSSSPVSGVIANQDGTLDMILGSHLNLNGNEGSVGQVVTSQGSGSAPTWETLQMSFRGYYASLAALQSAIPSGNDGDYAFVDAGIGTDAVIYIWDTDDNEWVSGGVTTLPDANESTKGVVEEGTQSEVNAGTPTGGTGAKLFITPAKLLALAATFANQITFNTAPILSSTTASKFLKTGASKETVTVDAASQSDAITGTDDTKPVTSKSLEDKGSVKEISVSNGATGSTNIDCLLKNTHKVLYNSTVTGNITITKSQDTNLQYLDITIPITGSNITITFPSDVRMARYNESGTVWNQSSKILTVSSIGTADLHEFSLKRVGSVFILKYDGPVRA